MKKNINFKKSLLCALRGLLYVFKNERNFRLHIFLTVIVFFMSLLFRLNTFEILIILIMVFMVLILEIINTVIENIMDFISEDYNENIKKIKDISAGAVLIAAITSFIVAFIIFVPKIIFLI